MNDDNQVSSQAFPLEPPLQGRKRLRNLDLDSSRTNKCKHIFVTLIRAMNVTCGLCRMPAGFHVIVDIDGRIIRTSNRPASIEKDLVEWNEEILLPQNQLSSISFSVYASFELGPRLGDGELLGQFKITVGELFHHRNEQLEVIDSIPQEGYILPSCCSFSIITKRRICGKNESCPRFDVPESREINALEQITDEGHRALLRYRQQQDQIDLDAAIQIFERAQDICPVDHLNRSAVLFNLANAHFIDCQANNRHLDLLDVPIRLYQDALRLRSKNHPDHCITALELGLALLVRFQRRGFESDREKATDLLAEVVEASVAENHVGRAGLFALQMAEASPLVEAGDIGSPPGEQVNEDDVIQETRDLLQNLSRWNPDRLALLVDLGVLLSDRFGRNGVLADINEAISMFEHALDLVPHGHADTLSLLGNLGSSLLGRFDHLGDLADLNRSISMLDEAVCRTPDGHPDKPGQLNNLGNSLLSRFERLGDLADLNRSISMSEEAACQTPDSHPNKPALLNNLGNSILSRFGLLGDLADLNRSISMSEEAVSLTPDGHPGKPGRLNNLGNSLYRRFEHLGDLADLTKANSIREEAVCPMSDSHPNKPILLDNLGNSLLSCFERLGDLADLNRSISMREEAVTLTPDSHPNKPVLLNNLGNSLLSRFKRLGDLADLNRSISIREKAVSLTPADHSNKPSWLNNLGTSLWHRFERLGDLADLNRSISMREQVVRLTPDGHPDKPGWLNNLGNSLLSRFKRLGDQVDLNKSNSMFEKVVCLTPDSHPGKPAQLSNLGNSLLYRFDCLGDLADLNKSISMYEEAVRLTLDDHPDKSGWLDNLGCSLLSRFRRLGDLADLYRSISVSEEVVCRTPDGHPDKPGRLNNLGNSLCRRFERFGDLADLTKASSIREEAVYLMPDGHPNKRIMLDNLGNSLLSCFEHFGDLENLNRSISTREEALGLMPSDHPEKPSWLNNLGTSLLSRFDRLSDLADLDRSILMFEEAVSLTSDGHPSQPGQLNNLGTSSWHRFQRLGDLADLNRSISKREQAVCLTPDSHPDKPSWLDNLGISLSCRFAHLGDLMDLNRSISMFEEAICLTPDDHPDKCGWLNNLGNALLSRFERLGDPADLKKSNSMYEKAVCAMSDSHSSKRVLLDNLGTLLLTRFECLGDLMDLNRSISMREEAVSLVPNGYPDKPVRLHNLGASLLRRFERLGNHADIVKSISLKEEAIALTPDGHPDKPALLFSLGNAFYIRFNHSHDFSDLSAAALNFSISSRASIGPTSTRFDAARSWISCAQLQGNTAALLDACASALDLLPQLAWLGLPVTERHRLLVKAADVTRDSVAAALEVGHPELAVEWLEQGRSIVWTQFLQLRTPVEELAHKHPALAGQLRQISQQLERASTRDHTTFYQPTNISVTDTRSLEEDIQRHHDLTLKREKLLAEIRSLTGFDRFLLSKTVKQLATLAVSGPVVYLTASKQRCDALIVMAESESVIHVPLPEIRYKDMVVMRRMLREMLERRHLILPRNALYELIPTEDRDLSKSFLDLLLDEDSIDRSGQTTTQRIGGYAKTNSEPFGGYAPNELYQKTLKYLWNYVVKPVFQALGFLNPPSGTDKTTRIFWCPTGPFSFLPIHAAGLYDPAEPGTKLSDFAISSYLPTLGSLVSSPQNCLNHSSKLRLLAVPQPRTDGLSKLSWVKDEINSIKELSNKSPFVILKGSDGTVEDVMGKLKNSDWVHFACHGMQDPKKPLDSGLCLSNKRRLKLSDIMQLSRPQGGVAFLSACQTAQGDETLSEESVHLAAGMLLAGYGGVIGTMWSIMDKDAPKVARDVYKYLFRDVARVPDSTEAAAALHRAIQHLRNSGAPFTSWVPFIHFGR